jgi:hypothetical protein
MNSKTNHVWLRTRYWITSQLKFWPIFLIVILGGSIWTIQKTKTEWPYNWRITKPGWPYSPELTYNIASLLLLTSIISLPITAVCTLDNKKEKADHILGKINYEIGKLNPKTDDWKTILSELVEKNTANIKTALWIEKKMNKEIFWHNPRFINIEELTTKIKEERRKERENKQLEQEKFIRDKWLKSHLQTQSKHAPPDIRKS